MNNQRNILKTSDFWAVFLFGVILNVAWGSDLHIRLALNSDLLPRLRWSQEPALYAQDMLRSTFGHNYSFHYLLPTWMASFLPLNFILAFLFMLQNFLGVYAVYYLAKYLFKKRSVGFLSLFLLFPGITLRWALGASVPFGQNIFPGLFSIPFLLYCILYFLKGGYLAAFLLLGIVFNFHGAHAVFVLCMFTFYLMFHFREFDKKLLIKCYALFTLGSLFLLVWMFLDKVPTSGSLSQEDWILFTRIRRSHHSYPFGFMLSQWEPFFCLLALLPLAWLARPAKPKQAVMNSFLVALVFMMIVGTVFTEIWPLTPVIKLSFFRSTRFFAIILMMYLANFAVEKFHRGSLPDQALVFLALVVIGHLNYQMGKGGNGYLSLFILLAVSLAFLFQHYYPRLRLGSVNLPTGLIAFCGFLLVFVTVFFTLIKPLEVFARYPVMNLYRLRLMVVAVFWAFLVFAAVFLPKTQLKRITTAVLVVVLTGFSLRLIWYYPPLPKYQAWYDLQVWFSEHTPKDSLVLVPPHRRGFRSYSGRGVYITWADADFPSYMPFLGRETVRRLRNVGYNFKKVYGLLPVRGWGLPITILKKFYQDRERGMTDKRVIRLAKNEGIDYMVTEAAQKRPFRPVYQNKYFLVYEVAYKNPRFQPTSPKAPRPQQ